MMYFATVCLIGLIALEVVHMVYFRSWNSEIFSTITGLIGTITGTVISQRLEKIFLGEGFEMSSVSARKLGNKSVRIQKPTNKLPVTDVDSLHIVLLQEHRNGGFVTRRWLKQC